MRLTTVDSWGRLSLMVLASRWLVPGTWAWTANRNLPLIGHSSSNTVLEMVRTRGLEQRREGATPTGACVFDGVGMSVAMDCFVVKTLPVVLLRHQIEN